MYLNGKQGFGKSYSAIDMLMEILRNGQKIITNIESFYLSHKDICVFEPNFYQIIEKFNTGVYDNNYIIFYDELFSLIDDKNKLPKPVKTFICQLRKRGLYLITTAQEWLDVNISFRRYVRYYVQCRMFNLFGLFALSINQVHDGYSIKWDKDLNEYDSPIIYTTIKKCSKNLADSYDTDEVIQSS